MSDDLEARIATLASRLDRESAAHFSRTTPVRPPSPRQRRPALVLAAALVLLLTAGVVVWVARPGSSPVVRSTPPVSATAPTSTAPPVAAVTPTSTTPPVAAVTSRSARCAPDVRPLAPGEYAYRRFETLALGAVAGAMPLNMRANEVIEWWIATDGSGRERKTFGPLEFASQADHDDWVSRGSRQAPFIDTDLKVYPSGAPPAPDTFSIPTDPDELLERLRAGTLPGYAWDPGNWGAFLRAGDIMHSYVLAPGLCRAVYEALQRLDGVQQLGEVQDHTGRTGVALAYASPDDGRLSTAMIFDPDTGELLEERAVGDDPELQTNVPAAEGSAYGRMTYLASGVVGSIDQVP